MLSLNPCVAMWQKMSTESIAQRIKVIRTNEQIALAFDYELFHDFPLWMQEEFLYVGYPVVEQRFGWQYEYQKHKHRFLITHEQLRDFLLKNKKLWVLMMSSDIHFFDNYKLPLNKKIILQNKRHILLEISLKNEK